MAGTLKSLGVVYLCSMLAQECAAPGLQRSQKAVTRVAVVFSDVVCFVCVCCCCCCVQVDQAALRVTLDVIGLVSRADLAAAAAAGSCVCYMGDCMTAGSEEQQGMQPVNSWGYL